jgi:ferritin-like metal-binding protein YciE
MSSTIATSGSQSQALELYLDGLKNAHALEQQATQLIERQLDRLQNYPEVEALLRRHLQETHRQIARLEEILGSFGEEPSAFKDMVTSLTGDLAALGHTVMSDEILKNHFANHAFENFEIAAYRSLIVMAEGSGRGGHVGALQDTLREEEQTAQTLLDMTEGLTRKYVDRYVGGQKADR